MAPAEGMFRASNVDTKQVGKGTYKDLRIIGI